MSYKYLQRKKETIAGKIVIGIDPSKNSHQALVSGHDLLQTGKTFSFRHSFDGFQNILWKNAGKYLPYAELSKIVFAVEASIRVRRNSDRKRHVPHGSSGQLSKSNHPPDPNEGGRAGFLIFVCEEQCVFTSMISKNREFLSCNCGK